MKLVQNYILIKNNIISFSNLLHKLSRYILLLFQLIYLKFIYTFLMTYVSMHLARDTNPSIYSVCFHL